MAMKVKNIVLGIKPKVEFIKGLSADWKRLEEGQQLEEGDSVYFENMDALANALTPLRIEILQAIKEKNPFSICGLAEMMGEGQGDIEKHITFLSDIGLIELGDQSKEGGSPLPRVDYDEIIIRIPLISKG